MLDQAGQQGGKEVKNAGEKVVTMVLSERITLGQKEVRNAVGHHLEGKILFT